jgi:hypothetical protein
MLRLQGNWPAEESRFQGIMQNFVLLWDEIGESRFKAAVDAIVLNSPFEYFPSIAEFRSFIPRTEQRPSSPNSKTKFADPNCAACFGGGYVVKDRLARMCACKQR